jgi:hypothetical protein
LLEATREYVAGFDPAVSSGMDAVGVMRDAAAMKNMWATVEASAASWVADSGVWRREGDRSAAHHLARVSGTSVGGAVEAIETARRLESLPKVAAEARRGVLSSAQSSAIASAAVVDPAAQSQLLARAAKSSLAELREECARVRAAADGDTEARRARIHRDRYLRSYTDGEGGWNLRARNNPEVGARFMAVLEPITDALFHAARREGRREPVEAYAADALSVLAAMADGDDWAGATGCVGAAGGGPPATADAQGQGSAAGGPPATADAQGQGSAAGGGRPATAEAQGRGSAAGGGRPATAEAQGRGSAAGGPPATADAQGQASAAGGPADDGAASDRAGDATAAVAGQVPAHLDWLANRAQRRRRARRSARTKVIVRVDLLTLLRGYPVSGETCELVGYGPVAVSAVRDMIDSGDPFLAAVATKGQAVVGVAHLGRRPNAAQQTALDWLFPACTVQGCSTQRHLEIDHRVDWADTHFTLLEWLDGLCKHHHLLKTRDGWALVEGTGKRALVPPDDPRHPRHRRARPP